MITLAKIISGLWVALAITFFGAVVLLAWIFMGYFVYTLYDLWRGR